MRYLMLGIGLTFSYCGAIAAQQATLPKINHIDEALVYPEGPVLLSKSIVLADMLQSSIKFFDPISGKNLRVLRIEGCGPTSITDAGGGAMYITCHLGAAVVKITAPLDQKDTALKQFGNARIRWPNDSVSDGRNGLFVTDSGVFDVNAPATGRVYHIDRNGATRELVAGLRYANGIYFSQATRRLYVSEHIGRRVNIYKLDRNFKIVSATLFFDFTSLPTSRLRFFDKMGPDGIDMDDAGNLVVAEYGAGRIVRLTAEGGLIDITDVPTQFVTNVAVSRKTGQIFFTGSFDLDAAEPKGLFGAFSPLKP